MEARDRKIEDWYSMVTHRSIKLPLFQRYESWDRERIRSLMNTIIRNLPLGITLVLNVGEKEQFASRYISTAEPKNGEKVERVLEQLLDGQQRITAVWRVLNNNYERETYYLSVPQFASNKSQDDNSVIYITRYMKGNQRYPLWCDSPEECLNKGYIPMDLFQPIDIGDKVDKWVEKARACKEPTEPAQFKKFYTTSKRISDFINTVRDVVKNYNLPFLALPFDTSKEVALDVFINMNTNSKPLSTYDIVVAEVENISGMDLHAKLDKMIGQYPVIAKFDEPSRLILNTTSLMQNKLPNQHGAWESDRKAMMDSWENMTIGLNRMSNFLVSEGIYDDNRLPTNAVLWVIASLYTIIPEAGDRCGWAEGILRQYLWRAFFTSRYELAAATNAYYDYLGLKEYILKGIDGNETKKLENIPIFNEAEYPISSPEELINAAWPKNRTIRGRAILAVAVKCGSEDFATGKVTKPENINNRHYHHIFPDAFLKDADVENRFIALNCALIEDMTNWDIGRKDPVEYLKDRYKWANKDTVCQRLHSHLIPITKLKIGDLRGLSSDETKIKVREVYNKFILSRAQCISKAAEDLCKGNNFLRDSYVEKYE